MKTPIKSGLLQSDIDFAGFKPVNADLSDYVTLNIDPVLEDWVSVKSHGAKGDSRFVTDASMNNASNVLTSATADFTAADVGKSVSINGVGTAGAILQTEIIGFTNSTTVTLAAAASTAASSQYCAFGTDDTSAVLAAITAASSVVYFPVGNYFFAGSIGTLPGSIKLIGANQFNCDVPPQQMTGTTLVITANPGDGSGTPFITIGQDNAVVGFIFFWPNQVKRAATPTAYPWAIHAIYCDGSTVKNVTMMNAYQGMWIEDQSGQITVERIIGQFLYRAMRIEGVYDYTVIKDCLFSCFWDVEAGNPNPYQWANAIAFSLGRTDGLSIVNCGVFAYHTWLYCYNDLVHTMGGPTAAWAQVHGGGCDLCPAPIVIDNTQTIGLDIDECWVTTVNGSADPAMVVGNGHTGTVRLKNSVFLHYSGTFGTVDGSGEVMVDSCHFFGNGWVTQPVPILTTGETGWTVTGTAGNFALRNCHFRTIQTHVSLGASVNRAVITGNMASAPFTVTNGIGANAIIANNTNT